MTAIKIIAVAIICCIIVYFIGTINVYLGSNSQFFKTAFDDCGSEWYCKEYDVTAVVLDEKDTYIMTVRRNDGEHVCTLQALDDFTVEIDCGKDEKLICEMRYKKRWGNITGFTIDVNSKNVAFERTA